MVGCGSFDGGRESSTNDQKYCAGTAVDEVGTVAAEKRSSGIHYARERWCHDSGVDELLCVGVPRCMSSWLF